MLHADALVTELVEDFLRGRAAADVVEDEVLALLLTVPSLERIAVVNELTQRGVPTYEVWPAYERAEGREPDSTEPVPVPPGVPMPPLPPPRPWRPWRDPLVLGGLLLAAGVAAGYAAGRRR